MNPRTAFFACLDRSPPALFEAAELKHGRQTQRHRNDGLVQVFLIFILMQRQLRTRFIAIKQTGIRIKAREPRLRRRLLRQSTK